MTPVSANSIFHYINRMLGTHRRLVCMHTSQIDPLFFREVGTITFVSFLEPVSALFSNSYLIPKCDVRLGLNIVYNSVP